MTKRKPETEKRKRGPKAGGDNDLSTWIAIEMRLRHDNLRRGPAGGLNRAIEALGADLRVFLRATSSSAHVTAKTLRNRYHRIERRRRADQAFAAVLAQTLAEKAERARAAGAGAIWLPYDLSPDRN
jgi:hypothetical protein